MDRSLTFSWMSCGLVGHSHSSNYLLLCMSEREPVMKRHTYLSMVVALVCLLSLFGLFGGVASAATRPVTHNQSAKNNGRQVVAYFTQWGIYSGFFEKN